MTRALLAIPVLLALLPAAAAGEVVAEGSIPEEIRSPSSIGEVVFPHLLHYEDLGLECASCHHETNASGLDMPHQSYFEDFWIDCRSCHRRDAGPTRPQSCGGCHHASPTGIADETLSAKVVMHKSCWQCHEVETGEAASRSCRSCHSGPRRDV